jgi:pimeloyl-ACP methyl ester carboxylesterase
VINLAYDDRGSGEPVLFISGSGGPGRTWLPHQVPAFVSAGYRVITFDNRGIGATENAEGFTTQTMVADTASLLESLGAAPARIVGVSMGAFIAQELMVARPELVTAAVLMATRGRLDRARQGFHDGEMQLYASNTELPPAYEAKVRVLENFSRKTINDDVLVADWITMFRTWPVKRTPGLRTQLSVSPQTSRLAAYRAITTPVLVMGFSDDVITPPHLGREVADALPNGRYVQIPDAGHLGFLERPDAVNSVALKFFADVKG